MTLVSPVLFIASLILDEGNEPIHLPLHAGLLAPLGWAAPRAPSSSAHGFCRNQLCLDLEKAQYVGMLAFSKQK